MTAAASTTHRPTTVIRSALVRTAAWLSSIRLAYSEPNAPPWFVVIPGITKPRSAACRGWRHGGRSRRGSPGACRWQRPIPAGCCGGQAKERPKLQAQVILEKGDVHQAVG